MQTFAMHHAKALGKTDSSTLMLKSIAPCCRRRFGGLLRLARQRNAFDLTINPKISIANGTMVGAKR